MVSRLCLMSLLVLGLVALSFGFRSRPYDRRPPGPFRPPVPTTPPFNPFGKKPPYGRYARDLSAMSENEQPTYLEHVQYEAVDEPSPRLRRFSVPIVVVPMPAPPPPPPMA